MAGAATRDSSLREPSDQLGGGEGVDTTWAVGAQVETQQTLAAREVLLRLLLLEISVTSLCHFDDEIREASPSGVTFVISGRDFRPR